MEGCSVLNLWACYHLNHCSVKKRREATDYIFPSSSNLFLVCFQVGSLTRKSPFFKFISLIFEIDPAPHDDRPAQVPPGEAGGAGGLLPAA